MIFAHVYLKFCVFIIQKSKTIPIEKFKRKKSKHSKVNKQRRRKKKRRSFISQSDIDCEGIIDDTPMFNRDYAHSAPNRNKMPNRNIKHMQPQNTMVRMDQWIGRNNNNQNTGHIMKSYEEYLYEPVSNIGNMQTNPKFTNNEFMFVGYIWKYAYIILSSFSQIYYIYIYSMCVDCWLMC